MTKTIHGTIHGRTIELNDETGLSDGQDVEVQVRPIPAARAWGNVMRLCLALLLMGINVELGGAQDKAKSERWEKEIAALEKKDQLKAPAKNGIVFAGSSSIRLWDVAKSFPQMEIINRGFGGSQIADSTHFADRLILKHEPRLVVVYAGDNDVAAGKTPEQVEKDFRALTRVIHNRLPKTRIAFIAIKPSIKRWSQFGRQQQANALVAKFCEKDERLIFIDVVKPMLGMDGQPKPKLFVADGLHLSAKGYELWTAIVKPHLPPLAP